jgi:glycosyltransferase involved in cell wall biosynthesis/SAM-dependent methyltransferase
MARYLYVASDLARIGVFETDLLDGTTERHQVALEIPPLRPDEQGVGTHVRRPDLSGAVVQAASGLLEPSQLRVARDVLHARKRLWVHWPSEGAVECVDDERLRSLWTHRLALAAMGRVVEPAFRGIEALRRLPTALRWAWRGSFPVYEHKALGRLQALYERARAVSFPPEIWSGRGIAGSGVYMRMDFWNRMVSGGSYGHTCYVAKELHRSSDDLVCLLAQRYELLDAFNVRQVAMDAPPRSGLEDTMATASDHYYPIVKGVCQALRNAYIYERLCLGNCAAAMVSRDLKIPYIVEYNGSELSMQKSFASASPYRHRNIYLAAEAFAFRQATVISVVSDAVRDDLIARGVDARKILVNPNGADLDAYAPAAPAEKSRTRRELGFDDGQCIVGFTATFGGWHGVDVLAATIPKVCASAPQVRFLLIGDGEHKPRVDEMVARHGLESRVYAAGRVPQAEGARLMKACDLYVAPHHAHMVDSKFFGSPTKVFEYMAMAGGTIASDLEQIGRVLSPALRIADLRRDDVTVSDERAVLCTAGDADELAEAIVRLAARPDLWCALGRNSRQAVADHYSWERHVDRLWQHARAADHDEFATIATGDKNKDEVQQQWNNSPVGSDRARRSQPHTLEWFREIEADRYGTYAPWMPSVMEFGRHAGADVLEIGGGLGIDLAQFASAGATVTDVDLSAGHLALAEEHFRLRGLPGRFVHHDGEELPFDANAFDLVYSNGVIHHTPNTARVVDEMFRVLRPGSRAIVMVYAEQSLHYWRNVVFWRGFKEGRLRHSSMGDILSNSVELSGTDARPLVKVYTRTRLRRLFRRFTNIQILQRQLQPEEVPRLLRPIRAAIEPVAGWNLVIKATKPRC